MNHPHMSKRIQCGAIVPGCTWTASAPTEEALLQKVAEHAADAHGIKDVTPDLAAQVKAAITDAAPA
jgi:predicted small metal-binding protein